jgi:hypothetical protein
MAPFSFSISVMGSPDPIPREILRNPFPRKVTRALESEGNRMDVSGQRPARQVSQQKQANTL